MSPKKPRKDRNVLSHKRLRHCPGRFRRLARAGVLVVAAGVVTAGLALLLTPDRHHEAAALGPPMAAPLPEPGGARAWEAEIPIAPFSSVHTRHGNVLTRIPIIGWSGRGPALSMMLYHNAATVESTLPLTEAMGFDLGPGWTTAYSRFILLDDAATPTTATVIDDDGARDVFTWTGTGWQPPAGVHGELTATPDPRVGPTFTLKHKDQSYERYSVPAGITLAFLDREVDATGNELIVERQPAPTGRLRLTSVTDASGRKILFEYDANGRLLMIRDPRADVEGSGTEPASATLPPYRDWQLEYDGTGRLNRITDPEGNYIQIGYDAAGRITSITDKWNHLFYGRLPGDTDDYELTYDAEGRLATVTAPLADAQEGRLTQTFSLTANEPDVTRAFYTDVRGETWVYWYGADAPVAWPDGNLRAITNPLGFAKGFVWDADRNMTQFEDESADIWRFTYDERGNLLRVSTDMHGRLTTASWRYDRYNRIISYSDESAFETLLLYENSGRHNLPSAIVELQINDALPETTSKNNIIIFSDTDDQESTTIHSGPKPHRTSSDRSCADDDHTNITSVYILDRNSVSTNHRNLFDDLYRQQIVPQEYKPTESPSLSFSPGAPGSLALVKRLWCCWRMWNRLRAIGCSNSLRASCLIRCLFGASDPCHTCDCLEGEGGQYDVCAELWWLPGARCPGRGSACNSFNSCSAEVR